MKTTFLFFVFLFFMGSVSAQHKHYPKRDTIIVDGFNGNKPLKETTDVPVRFTDNPHADVYLLPAYKGETKQKFIARLKDEQKKYQPVNKNPSKNKKK